jgi:hypothetical protein
MGAAARVYGNFAQALRTLFGARVGRFLATVHAGNERIHWQHHKKVNHGRDQHE